MTEQEIRDRIEHLSKKREEFVAEIHALTGAIKDCEFWLERLPKENEVKEPRLVSKE
jgi:hypothetical protein